LVDSSHTLVFVLLAIIRADEFKSEFKLDFQGISWSDITGQQLILKRACHIPDISNPCFTAGDDQPLNG
jgi:hypothetical protein